MGRYLAWQPLPVPLSLSEVELVGLEEILCLSLPTLSCSVTCRTEAGMLAAQRPRRLLWRERSRSLSCQKAWPGNPGAKDKVDLDLGSQARTRGT